MASKVDRSLEIWVCLRDLTFVAWNFAVPAKWLTQEKWHTFEIRTNMRTCPWTWCKSWRSCCCSVSCSLRRRYCIRIIIIIKLKFRIEQVKALYRLGSEQQRRWSDCSVWYVCLLFAYGKMFSWCGSDDDGTSILVSSIIIILIWHTHLWQIYSLPAFVEQSQVTCSCDDADAVGHVAHGGHVGGSVAIGQLQGVGVGPSGHVAHGGHVCVSVKARVVADVLHGGHVGGSVGNGVVGHTAHGGHVGSSVGAEQLQGVGVGVVGQVTHGGHVGDSDVTGEVGHVAHGGQVGGSVRVDVGGHVAHGGHVGDSVVGNVVHGGHVGGSVGVGQLQGVGGGMVGHDAHFGHVWGSDGVGVVGHVAQGGHVGGSVGSGVFGHVAHGGHVGWFVVDWFSQGFGGGQVTSGQALQIGHSSGGGHWHVGQVGQVFVVVLWVGPVFVVQSHGGCDVVAGKYN